MGLFVGMGPYVDKHLVPKKKKDILLYKCPQNKRASHKVFMLNRWCLLLTNHYTRNPIYGNMCWISSLKIFKRSQTAWHHYISLWAITAFENWKRNNDDKFFSISLSLFSKSKMVCLKCSNQRHIPEVTIIL